MTVDLKHFEQVLLEFYEKPGILGTLSESVIYSLTAGGKRLRPFLLLTLLEAFGLELTEAHYRVAAALELVHTGSLIHDDLPAMDNDDFRRGKPTNHKAFSVPAAILAGDALFLDPYYVLATSGLSDVLVVQLVRELSYASGSLGMVAGQSLDVAGEGQTLSLAEIERIHQLKTGRLLTFPFVAAGIIARRGPDDIEHLRAIGQQIGLAFQIRDDILDVTGTLATLGKTPGKDLAEDKATYVSLLGLDGAKKTLSETLRKAKSGLLELSAFDGEEILRIVEKLNIE